MIVNIRYKGIDLEVKGNFYPGEDEVLYDSDGGGYPGSSPEFEVLEIYVESNHVNIFYLLEDDIESIEELCLERII